MFKIDTAKLLEKEMDRKDFLKHVGIGLVAMSGFAAALKTLGYLPTSQSRLLGSAGIESQPQSQVQAATSYGASVYGGVKPHGV